MSWFDQTYGRVCVPVLMRFLQERVRGKYIAPDGTETLCWGIVTNIGKVPEAEDLGSRVRVEREWIISTDPCGDYGGVAEPETKATVELGGETFAVEDVEAISGNLTRLSLVQLPLKRRSRGEYRRA